MAVVFSETVPLTTEPDIVVVRRRVREVAGQIGLSLVDQTKVITAASELARNTLIYGGGGSMQLESLNGSTERFAQLRYRTQDSLSTTASSPIRL